MTTPCAYAPRRTEPEPAWTTGGAFLDALASRDFAALETCLAPDVRFRALVPPGLREEHSAAAAVAHLRQWFGTADRFGLTDAELGQAGPLLHLRWCARTVDAAGTVRHVEQHAYARVEDRIVTLDLLCSGFHEAGDDVR